MADYTAGAAYVQVLPSLRGWTSRVRSQLAGELRGVRPEITVTPDVDTGAARAQLRSLSATRPQISINPRINRAALTSELRWLSTAAPSVNIPVDADTAAASAGLARVNRQAERLDGKNVSVDTRGTSVAMLTAQRSTGALMTAIVGLAPAAVPALAGVGAAAGGLAAGLTAAGAGAGAMALVAAPAISTVTEAVEAQDKAQQELAETGKVSESTQQELAAAMAAMTGPQRGVYRGFLNLRSAYLSWAQSLQPQVLPLLTRGMNLAARALPMLTPLVRSSARAFDFLLRRAQQALGSPFWQQFVQFLAGLAGPAIRSFGLIVGNLARGFAGLLMAFRPLAVTMLQGLTQLTAGFAAWGASLRHTQGFRNFLDYVNRVGPLLLSTLGALWRAVVRVFQAMAPFGGPVLAGLRAVLNVIARMPVNVLRALVAAFIAWRLVMFGVNTLLRIFTVQLQIARARMIAVYLAQRLAAVATAAWTAVTRTAVAVNSTFNVLQGLLVRRTRAATAAMIRQRVALMASAVATRVVAAATRVYAVAMRLLNLAMRVNPILGIISVLLLLGTTLVMAYRRSKTFRNIVNAAFRGVAAVIGAAIGFIRRHFRLLLLFLGPAGLIINALIFLARHWRAIWGGIRAVIRGVGRAATWLWRNAIRPAFRGIWLVARVMFAVVVTAVLTPILLAMRGLGAVAKWLWRVAIRPAFRGIAALARWLWRNGIRPALRGINAGFRSVAAVGRWLWRQLGRAWNAIGGAVRAVWRRVLVPIWRGFRAEWRALRTLAVWLYRRVLQPIWRGIGAAIRAVWNRVLVPIWRAFHRAWNAIARAARVLWRNGIAPAFRGIGSVIRTVWRAAIRPAFNAIKHGVGLVRRAFGHAVDAIRRIWNGLRQAAMRPVRFVVNTVYNQGIRRAWNAVAGLVNLRKLPEFHLASGGTLAAGGRTSRPTAIVGEGSRTHPEYVIPTDPQHRGRARALYSQLGPQLMADGGVLGRVGGALGGAWNALKRFGASAVDFFTNPGRALRRMMSRWLDLDIPGGGLLRGAMTRLPREMVAGLVDKVKDAFASLAAPIGPMPTGGAVARWAPTVRQALAMLGQPMSLVPTVLRLIAKESGGNPRAINLWDVNARNGTPSMGLIQTIMPTFQAYAGPFRGSHPYNPLANIYAGLNYALSRYGSIAAVDPLVHAGGYDAGGTLPPGLSLAYNGTRRPERVLTDAQWRAITAGTCGGDDGYTVNIYPRQVDINEANLRAFEHAAALRARAGRPV